MQPDFAGCGGGRRPVREDGAALRRPRHDGAGWAIRREGAVVLDYAVHAEGIADAHRVAPLAGGVARIRDALADRVGLAADRDRARRRGRRWRVPADHTAADLFTGRVRAPYDLGVAGRRVDGDVEAAQVGPRDVGAEPGYGGDLERDQAVVARLQHRQPVRRPEVEDIAADVSRDGPRAAVGAGRITQPAEHAHVRTGRGSEPGGTVREARDDAERARADRERTVGRRRAGGVRTDRTARLDAADDPPGDRTRRELWRRPWRRRRGRCGTRTPGALCADERHRPTVVDIVDAKRGAPGGDQRVEDRPVARPPHVPDLLGGLELATRRTVGLPYPDRTQAEPETLLDRGEAIAGGVPARAAYSEVCRSIELSRLGGPRVICPQDADATERAARAPEEQISLPAGGVHAVRLVCKLQGRTGESEAARVEADRRAARVDEGDRGRALSRRRLYAERACRCPEERPGRRADEAGILADEQARRAAVDRDPDAADVALSGGPLGRERAAAHRTHCSAS